MNQAKYSVYACLILLLLTTGVYSFNKLSSVPIIQEKHSPIIDDDQSQTKEFNSIGKQLFQQNCASCHSIHKNLTAPGLADIEQRGPWTDRKNLIKWIKNPAEFLATSEYASDLQKAYNGALMPSFPQLKDDEIYEILDYIKYTSTNSIVY